MPARTEIRAIAAAACALGLLGAGIALAQAPRWPDADDIERARKAHPSRKPDRLGAQPVPAPPRVNLPADGGTHRHRSARPGWRATRQPVRRATAAVASHLHHAGRCPARTALTDQARAQRARSLVLRGLGQLDARTLAAVSPDR